MEISKHRVKRERCAVRTVGRLGASAAVALLALAVKTASACPTLTPSILEEYMAQGQIAFALDDEGKAATTWYFDPTQIAASGAITGTMSTSAVTPSEAAPFYPISGTASGSGSLTVSIAFSTGIPEIIGTGIYYSYTGAIMFADAQCDLLIAGTYTTTSYTFRETPIGPIPVAHTSPATPFSGKLVGYVFE
jgi:hypothetical protein